MNFYLCFTTQTQTSSEETEKLTVLVFVVAVISWGSPLAKHR